MADKTMRLQRGPEDIHEWSRQDVVHALDNDGDALCGLNLDHPNLENDVTAPFTGSRESVTCEGCREELLA